MYCFNCGSEITHNRCDKCGTYINIDKPNFILELISFFSPFIGFIFYICFKKDRPLLAALCGKMALLSISMYIIIIVMMIIYYLINGTIPITNSI